MNAHEVIRKPLVTEKSNIGREEKNLVSFAVDLRATKPEIRSVTPAWAALARPAYKRTVFDRGEKIEAMVLQRASLSAGAKLSGPLIIEQYDTTCYVPGGFGIRVDERGNLVGTRG